MYPASAKVYYGLINLRLGSGAMESSLQAGMLFEQVQSIYSLGSEDKAEAAAAFREKRKPHFTGR
jgi:enoyl-CoA hydratase/carnithine racemase